MSTETWLSPFRSLLDVVVFAVGFTANVLIQHLQGIEDLPHRRRPRVGPSMAGSVA